MASVRAMGQSLGQAIDDGVLESCFQPEAGAGERLVKLSRRAKRAKTVDLAKVFAKDKIDAGIQEEVAQLFRRYDQDGSGSIEAGPELTAMIDELRKRGYAFGAPTGRSDGGGSHYKGVPPSQVKLTLLEHLHGRAGGRARPTELPKSASVEGMQAWFRDEVCTRRRNLRLLLRDLPCVDSALLQTFAMADSDGSGQVDVGELTGFLTEVSQVLGEPPPDAEEVREILDRADASLDGLLSYREFRHVVIEVMARLYYTHYNGTMNIHMTLDRGL